MTTAFKPFAFLQAVRDDSRLSVMAKSVAVIGLLSRRHHLTGLCNPGLECIKSDTGFKDERTISKAIRELVETGVIAVKKEKGRSNSYELLAGQVPASDVPTSHVPTTWDVPTWDVPTSDVPTSHVLRVPTSHEGGVPPSHVGLRREERKEEEIRKETKKTTVQTDTSNVAIAPASDSFSLKAKKEKPEPKPTRLSIEQLPYDWFVDVMDIQPELDAYKLFDEFVDFWANEPGNKGKKIDWRRTWKNHLRNFPEWKKENYMRNGYPEFEGERWRRPVDPNSSLGIWYRLKEEAEGYDKAEDDLVAFAEGFVKGMDIRNHD